MLPPVACWPDGAALTFHYEDLSVIYHKNPIDGSVIPLSQIPRANMARIVLWMAKTPLLEVSIDKGQRPIFSRLESDKPGIAKAYLVGWQQNENGQSVQSIGYYLPPNSSTVGRIVIAGEYEQSITERFDRACFEQSPVPCWPDSTTYSFHYADGTRIDRINRETGEESTSENLSRVGLQKVTLWHHGFPVIECHYQKGQRAIFRRRNEWNESAMPSIGGGLPLDALISSTSWFANQKAVQEGKHKAFYLLGWKQPLGNKSTQAIAYFYPQNGEKPPRVVLAGKFCENGDSYLPIPVGKDDEVIT